MNRRSIREHGVHETANSNRAASTQSASTSLRGRLPDDASRPMIVALERIALSALSSFRTM
jgi:hypothetical protein